MFVVIRSLTWATLFIAFVLWFVPAGILSAAGIRAPASFGAWQAIGVMLGAAGAVLALVCILTFTFVGRGTPAPFDPPRRLVVRGPYRLIRNPMYAGAALWIIGTALFYRSIGIAVYAAVFLIVTHIFVVTYEEPTLQRMFGRGYDDYCRRVGRWWPRSSPT
jgi:protein-S-isoprenylcysteine O-methyltransferase Ste14